MRNGDAPVGRLGVLLVSATLGLVSWASASRSAVPAWERSAGRRIAGLPEWMGVPLQVTMQAGTRLAVVVVVVVLLAGRRWRESWVVGGSAAAAWCLAALAKEVVGRDRPTAALLGAPVREVVEGLGYPSTHTAVAFGLAVALVITSRLPRPATVAVLAVAALTGLARVYLGVHWTADVVGGAALGGLCASAAALLALSLRR